MAWNWSQQSSQSWGSYRTAGPGRAARMQGAMQATSIQDEYRRILSSYYSAQSQVLAEVGYTSAVVASWSAHNVATMAANQAVNQLGTLVAIFADAMATEIQESQGGFLMDVYSNIAQKAQKNVLDKYRLSRRREELRYRGGDPGGFRRFSDGAMLKALSEPGNLFRVTPDGIEYVNAPLLDMKAPQWYRLNFGARPADTPAVRNASIQFFDTKLPGIGFEGAQPSKPFSMPRGVWSSEAAASTASFSGLADGGSAFYPLNLMKVDKMANLMGGNMNNRQATWSQAGRRATRGIVGGRFLDYGAQTVNREIGPALEFVARTWVSQAADQVSRPVASPSPLNLTEESAISWLGTLNSRLASEVSKNSRATQDRLREAQFKAQRMTAWRLGGGRL